MLINTIPKAYKNTNRSNQRKLTAVYVRDARRYIAKANDVFTVKELEHELDLSANEAIVIRRWLNRWEKEGVVQRVLTGEGSPGIGYWIERKLFNSNQDMYSEEVRKAAAMVKACFKKTEAENRPSFDDCCKIINQLMV